MKKSQKNITISIIAAIAVILIIVLILVCTNNKDTGEIRTIKSEKELLKIYNREDVDSNVLKEIVVKINQMPFEVLETIFDGGNGRVYYKSKSKGQHNITDVVNGGINPGSIKGSSSMEEDSASLTRVEKSSTSKDYSTTNIQVENVDEADITKTDGNYIYSISEDKVIITNAIVPEELKIEGKISPKGIPEDLLIYGDKLVIISATDNSRSYSTNVEIYDVSNKSNPKIVKKYDLYEPYYTSRCINNQLYVIASGMMRKENDKIVRKYSEDGVEKEVPLSRIKYLKDLKTTTQTIISSVDLNNVNKDIKIDTYLMDVSNAYVSEKNIYLLDEKYSYMDEDNHSKEGKNLIKYLFTPKGIFGLLDYINDYDYSIASYRAEVSTQIYKFKISESGEVTYKNKTKTDGKTINQYSLDEKDNHLRIALDEESLGTKIKIFDENLKQIGETEYVGQGEDMYSSRFIGDKAYLVTYRTIDPLFVIDLSNETAPRVLGELKIPGYSTYLHPYDENHLIGIGMQTEENVNRNSIGKVISTSARITGMKMALFDVTDVNNPVQMSEVTIGDSRTTSAILTNPKALLFSKEKELIAIPVNNYNEDFSISATSKDTYGAIEESYKNYSKNYVSEGYLVYKINLEEGLKLKGTITHENNKVKEKYYNYRNNSKLLRGLYIENNLYTISETKIKVNNLETLNLVKELEINKD